MATGDGLLRGTERQFCVERDTRQQQAALKMLILLVAAGFAWAGMTWLLFALVFLVTFSSNDPPATRIVYRDAKEAPGFSDN